VKLSNLEEYFKILISVSQNFQKLILQNPAYSLETQKFLSAKFRRKPPTVNFFLKMHQFCGNESQKFLPQKLFVDLNSKDKNKRTLKLSKKNKNPGG